MNFCCVGSKCITGCIYVSNAGQIFSVVWVKYLCTVCLNSFPGLPNYDKRESNRKCSLLPKICLCLVVLFIIGCMCRMPVRTSHALSIVRGRKKKLVWTLQVSGQNFACSMLYQSDLIGKNLYGSCRHLVRTSHALCCISLF